MVLLMPKEILESVPQIYLCVVVENAKQQVNISGKQTKRKMKMKKKSERKLKKEELRKKLADAIELRLRRMEEYRKTPSKKHLEDLIVGLDIEDDGAVMIAFYNKKAQTLQFKGIKCTTSDLMSLAQYVYVKAVQDSLPNAMDAICTMARQAELNECWTEHHEKEKEIKDDGKTSE